MELRQLSTDEATAAHALYLDIVAWLKAKGIRQWLRPLDVKEFHERQVRAELFGAFADGRMVATVSLACEDDDDWAQHIGREKRWWLKTLAVARGGERGLGERIVHACEGHLQGAGAREIYLECVDTGFLPGYYERLGYEVRQRADITYPSGNTFPVALMRKLLAP
jgi:predicted N-acetyltransferase YhbS